MNNIELLSPVGDFECLKAAVQNGANAVYLGATNFSARSSAKNFDLQELKNAIDYAHLRNVKVHLALNTLIKDDEFNTALELASNAYELGIDAIIVQDFGLANFLINKLPNLPIHASTQMSIHNLEGAKYAEKLGFSRIVLSRELSLSEIEFIKNNTNIELEVFIHGALCISYSGQCLLSSMIGGRSGNRGKCAQACRLPYKLVEESENSTSCINSGYILSPKDLCGLEFIPKLIDLGIASLKIEGRMKTPQYVATVTRIYRKYIDLALSGKNYVISQKDKKDLLQVFNRGGFSTGHLLDTPNRHLIFKDKPNNMGIYIGNVSHFNSNKGYINLNLNDTIAIGDTISFENEPSKYKISELLINNKNAEHASSGQTVKIGRMKGNIKIGDKIYKLESKTLSNIAKDSYSTENIKNKLICNLTFNENAPIIAEVYGPNNLHIAIKSDELVTSAKTAPITAERIITQFNKTSTFPFEFEKININLKDNLYVNISVLNDLRRKILERATQELSKIYERKPKKLELTHSTTEKSEKHKEKKISILLNILDENTNYSLLENVDNVYIPLKYFAYNQFSNIIKSISINYNTYIYMPTIIKANYRNLFTNNIDKALEKYNIKGFVISNMGTINFLDKYKDKYEFIGNYTLNIFNTQSMKNFNKLGIKQLCLSPELNKETIDNIISLSNLKTELIVYGRTPVMNLGYCLLGNSNKCYPECSAKCMTNSKFYLKDRLNLEFRVIPDNVQTINTIYNSKITSISSNDVNVDSVRIDVLDENILTINDIIKTVKEGNRSEGKDYTNGNFAREV